MTNIAMEAMAIEIVDLPLKHAGSLDLSSKCDGNSREYSIFWGWIPNSHQLSNPFIDYSLIILLIIGNLMVYHEISDIFI